MLGLARTTRLKALSSASMLAAAMPLSSATRVEGGEMLSLGAIWGMAVVLWGLCALVVALFTLLRTPGTDDQIGRIHSRIRRFRFSRSLGAAGR
jgi:hypothetical protein